MPNSASTPPAHSSGWRRILTSLVSVVALVVALGLAWWLTGDDTSAPSAESTQTVAAQAVSSKSASRTSQATSTRTSAATSADVPERVQQTLALIDAGRWPEAANAPGTHGGDRFGNYERRLPTTGANGRRLTFQEWDVNPKRRGSGRDAERIITADDGSAWYTLDHYRTFVKIRGPSS